MTSLDQVLDLFLSSLYADEDKVHISKDDMRRLRNSYNRIKRKGLLDTPYTRDFAPLLDEQLRLLSRGKLERFV